MPQKKDQRIHLGVAQPNSQLTALCSKGKQTSHQVLPFSSFLNVNDQTNPTINLRKALVPVARATEQTIPKCSGVELPFIRPMDSVDWVVRQGTAGTAGLCSLRTGASAAGQSMKSSEGSVTHVWQRMDAGLLHETFAEAISCNSHPQFTTRPGPPENDGWIPTENTDRETQEKSRAREDNEEAEARLPFMT